MNATIRKLFTPYRGSNRISRILRAKVEALSLPELIGIPLISIAFFGAFVLPQVQAGFSQTELYFDTQADNSIAAVVSESRFRWPFPTFGISQYYHGGHPGLDLTNPAGTPVYPVSDGTVIFTATFSDGYGKHVIIRHANGMTSISAHLSSILVKDGQHVSKSTELGTVGRTGWATGNHLHLEIHQDGVAVNPIEVLPEIRKYQPFSPTPGEKDVTDVLPQLSL